MRNLVFVMVGMLCLSAALDQVRAAITPLYTNTFNDSVTGNNRYTDHGDSNKQRWVISPGADSYPNDFYERPTVQEYKVYSNTSGGTIFAAKEYFEYLDIVKGSAGFDDHYLYVSIEMYGLDKHTEDNTQTPVGLVERYGFRIGKNSVGPASAGGMLLYVDNPAYKLSPTQFNGDKAEGFLDVNGSVGGTSITIPNQSGGNGYESQVIDDGKRNGSLVLMSRINPSASNIVEFVFDYAAFGYSTADLSNLLYLEFEAIKGGAKDPQNYLWNDKYNSQEAGSPYRATTGDTSKSIYGTQGLENIYELDTLKGGLSQPLPGPLPDPVHAPLPSAAWAGLSLLGALGLARLYRRPRA